MNPHSGWFAKGVSVLGLLPLASVVAKPVLTQLGSLSAEAGELGRLSSEFDELGNLTSLEEEAAEKGTALHHIFPQEFRERFEELGIDIDKYTIRLDAQTEHVPLHVGVNTEEWAGGYNDHWAVFFEQEGIASEDAFEFAAEFLNDLGLAGPEYPIVPFM